MANLAEEYDEARIAYLKAVLNNNQDNEIKNLKILIDTGKKLKKDVNKYEKELKKYNNKSISSAKKIEPLKIKPIQKTSTLNKTSKATITKLPSDFKYTIKSVEARDNMILIDFKTKITKDYVNFFEKKEKNGYQDIYELKGSFKDAYPTKLSIEGVKQIVINQKDSNTLTILFEDNKNLNTIYFVNNNRIVLKVLDSKETVSNKVKISKSPKIYKPGLNRVVVLDAGHGGKDSGAIGREKEMYEKYTVFNVTKYLEYALKDRGYKVYLTRNSDRFIKVHNRTVLANEKKADIFISVHANAAHKSKIDSLQGIETFFLSPARSARAKRVAALENKSDIRNMSGSSKQAFLESLNRPRITASHKLSIDIQKNMLYETRKIYKDVVDSGVREGPFWVLVGAQMPSVLIEIGYITHKKEGERLFQKKYQEALAVGIANGIDSYFAKNP